MRTRLVVEIDDYYRDAIIRHRNGTYGAQLPYYVVNSVLEAIAKGTPVTEGDLIMFRTLMTEIANKGLPFEEVLLLIDNAKTPTEGDCISRKVVKGLISDKSIPIKFEEEKRGEWRRSSGVLLSDAYKAIDTAPPVPQVTVFAEDADEKAIEDMKAELQSVIEPRPQGKWVKCLKETTFDDYLKEQLKDPEFRKEWEKLRDDDFEDGAE